MSVLDPDSPYAKGRAVTNYVYDLMQYHERRQDPTPCGVVVSPRQYEILRGLEIDGEEDRAGPAVMRCMNGLMLVHQLYVIVKDDVSMPYLIWSYI